ncbi:phosphatase PAP2 family protein [Pseudobutyrivibrio sp. MD2005]|uniref:phosphatase PAP2 family protein n=1 Tax=Pseudobutyrivibrio sp. MD2005 TaxID=1410616 RepID=UPI000562E7F9|nr:phosphatase PAP2 family protein [Pseudobutyrivibrio sp. MD2005]
MEFQFLYAIPRMEVLDSFFLTVNKITGSYGQLWVVIAVILLFFKKTRKIGVAVLVSYVLVYVLGQYGLKNMFSRMRPCQIDETFELLVARPSSLSFPSTHSAWAFGAATAIFLGNKKGGFIALIWAALIAFSRMYLFLHFPTDVLAGIVFGALMGIIAVKLVDIITKKIGAAKAP